MAAFEYEALNPSGRSIRGVMEGDGERQIRGSLREQGLTPLTVVLIRHAVSGSRGASPAFGRAISNAALAMLTRQFATLVQAGLTLEESLNALIEQTEERRVRAVLAGVRAKLLEGQPLARAMGAFPTAFPEIYRHMVDAGEQSGRLDTVLERLADYTEQRQALQQRVVLAFIYPAIVTVVAIAVVTGLLVYVVPSVTQVFVNSGQQLPWATRTLIDISAFVRAGGVLWPIGLVILIGGVRMALRQTRLRRKWHRLQLRLPVVGRLVRGLNAARLASTLGILTSSGIPLLMALEYAVQVVPNLPMRDAVDDALRQVREGGSFSRALARPKVFPPLVIHLIASGEASGRLDLMLGRAAQAQARELEGWVSVLTTLLEPVLILIMGGVVLFIVLAILLPIFDMNQLIK
ncbi:MAG: type II secretion system inner membrane protein GspF [Acidiferrobacteraceae bacterium]